MRHARASSAAGADPRAGRRRQRARRPPPPARAELLGGARRAPAAASAAPDGPRLARRARACADRERAPAARSGQAPHALDPGGRARGACATVSVDRQSPRAPPAGGRPRSAGIGVRGRVERGVGAAHPGARRHEVPGRLPPADGPPHLRRRGPRARLPVTAGMARDRLASDVDRRVAPALGDAPVEDQVAVEQPLDLRRDRVLGLVPSGEDRVHRGDGAPGPRAWPARRAGEARRRPGPGSPGAPAPPRRPSPTSRTARAKRVSESTSRSTLRPSTRANHSATAVATWADRIRTTAGASLVAATTTLRREPLRPQRVLHHLADLPPTLPHQPHARRPRRRDPRASRPRSEDFPAPGPAKSPIRCPSARVANPSTARTPVAKGRASRGRSSGPGAARSTSQAASPRRQGPSVDGAPQPVEDPPQEAAPHPDLEPPAGPPDQRAGDGRPRVPERQQDRRRRREAPPPRPATAPSRSAIGSTSTCSCEPRAGARAPQQERASRRGARPIARSGRRRPHRSRRTGEHGHRRLLVHRAPQGCQLGTEPAVHGRPVRLDDHLARARGPGRPRGAPPRQRRESPVRRSPARKASASSALTRSATGLLPRSSASARPAAARASPPGRTSRARIRPAISTASPMSSPAHPASRRSRSAAPRTTSAAARASPSA